MKLFYTAGVVGGLFSAVAFVTNHNYDRVQAEIVRVCHPSLENPIGADAVYSCLCQAGVIRNEVGLAGYIPLVGSALIAEKEARANISIGTALCRNGPTRAL